MPEEVAGRLFDILRKRNPGIVLRDDLPLGRGGVELDSVGIVDVLLECENTFGVTLAAEMLDAPALTVGLLAERIQALQA